jgi:hypothetical protein
MTLNRHAANRFTRWSLGARQPRASHRRRSREHHQWLALIMVLQLVIGAWRVDSSTSLGIVWFLVREGNEAWEEGECCHDH